MTVNDLTKTCNAIQDIIGTDAGDRGMKPLIVPGDLEQAATVTVNNLEPNSKVVILSGFPCCVKESPPTETDGPPGTFAIARCIAALGHQAIVVTDECNQAVFAAALQDLVLPSNSGPVTLLDFPATLNETQEKSFQELANSCQLLIACERAGPGKSGSCYTMRGIDMNEKGLIAPLHRLVDEKDKNVPFIAIGDGGNELGMGKVIDKIIDNPKIANGDQIGCVVAANHLIAASVSNWGGYALAAAIAVAHVQKKKSADSSSSSTTTTTDSIDHWVERCVPTAEEETALLNRCVAAGCRDGVSGKMEATVDGMPLETSLQCLSDIRTAALDSK